MFPLSVVALLLLIFAHLLGDYPLQGDFLARAKNHRAPLPGVPWSIALTSHAGIQGGLVALAMNSAPLGLMEFVAHSVIDFAKSAGWLGAGGRGFAVDQALHIACKAVWIVLWSHGVR